MTEKPPSQAYGPTMSGFYDLDWDAIDLDRDDVEFYVHQAARTSGSICEVGAGTGRVLFQLAEATGRPCVGVEPSLGMRQRFEAYQMEAGRALYELTEVVAGSFSHIPLPDASQGFVFSAFRSFMHVLTREEQLDALREMRRVLAPDGLLAMDLFEPQEAHMENGATQQVYRAEVDDGGTVSRFDTRCHTRSTQCVHVDMAWVTHDAEGHPTGTSEDSYTVRYTFREELFELLGHTDWELVDVFGDFDRSPLDDTLRQLIVVARPVHG
jgi:ubiquinone/menaquinone biosynthesis C-methylase UbiE